MCVYNGAIVMYDVQPCRVQYDYLRVYALVYCVVCALMRICFGVFARVPGACVRLPQAMKDSAGAVHNLLTVHNGHAFTYQHAFQPTVPPLFFLFRFVNLETFALPIGAIHSA
jgi:hypothetical protein